MNKQTEALKLALKALKQIDEAMPFPVAKLAQKVIREALAQPEPSAYWHSEFLKYNTTSDHRMMENAQGDLERIKLVQTGVGIGKPEQEPVAWMTPTGALYRTEDVDGCFDDKHIPLYTTPPQRKPLTDEEIEEINVSLNGKRDLARMFARAIEAAHGIKE